MFESLVRKIVKREKAFGKIDISFVNEAEIRKLNKKFRKKDKPTDVLSFVYDKEGILGDVIISPETARKNARRFGVTYKVELKRLAIHGVLHVLGYDHGRKMQHAEKIYTQL